MKKMIKPVFIVKQNKKLVQKILEENRESKTMAIFNKKYIDIINEIRFDENNVYFFLKKIKEKEKNVKQNNNIDIEKYIKLIKDLLYNYEKYFYDKVGRQNNTKKNKMNDNKDSNLKLMTPEELRKHLLNINISFLIYQDYFSLYMKAV